MKAIMFSSGGSGTRLWPLSRKFFIKFDNKFLFKNTIKRNIKKISNKLTISSNENHYF